MTSRGVALAALAVAGASFAHAAQASAAEGSWLRVRGTQVVEVGIHPAGSQLELRGRVVDEAGRPVGGAGVRVDGVSVQACDGPEADLRTRITSPDGRFCGRFSADVAAGGLRIQANESELYDASPVLELDPASPLCRPTLRASATPGRVALPGGMSDIRVRAEIAPWPACPPSAEVSLRLDGPSARELGRGELPLGAEWVARLTAEQLGAPGTRQVQVVVDAPRVRASTQVEVVVAATPTFALQDVRRSAAGTVSVIASVGWTDGVVDGGVVELYVAGQQVAAGMLVEGIAELTLPDGPATELDATLRYRPLHACWIAPEPLPVRLVIPPTPWWSTALLGALAALAVAGLGWAWVRPRPGPAKQDEAPPSGRAAVVVVRAPPGAKEWEGRVRDAHDGLPVPSASVTVLLPGFGAEPAVLGACRTNDTGAFRLGFSGDVPPAARFVVEAPEHDRLELPAPARGTVNVELIQRRRALLEHFVRWARRTAGPWQRTREPTPAEVAEAARKRGAPEVAGWAARLERAAWAAAPPSADEAAELRRGGPGAGDGPAPLA